MLNHFETIFDKNTKIAKLREELKKQETALKVQKEINKEYERVLARLLANTFDV